MHFHYCCWFVFALACLVEVCLWFCFVVEFYSGSGFFGGWDAIGETPI